MGLTVITAAVFGVGCGPGTFWHLLKGEQMMKAEHPLTPPDGESEVTVAVSVTAHQGVPIGIDLDLASKIGSQLTTFAELNDDTPVKVIDQSKVNAFKASDPTRWITHSPGEFAAKLGADYWIDVTVVSLKLMDRDLGNEVCRGSAVVEVAVYEAGKSAPKYTYTHTSLAQLKPTDPAQIAVYRNTYLGQLATELTFRHVKYKMDQKRALEK